MAPVRPFAIPFIARPTPGADSPEFRLKELLQTVNAALRAGDIDRALRCTDRVWRHARADYPITNLYGRLLAHTGENAAALRLLTAAAERQTDPDLEAQIVETMIAAGQHEAAAERLGGALRRLAVEPAGQLAAAARRGSTAVGPGCGGWIGITPGLELIGEIPAPRQARLELRTADGAVVAETVVTGPSGGVGGFRLAPLRRAAGAALDAMVNGIPLLGSPLPYPPEFDLDGRAGTDGNRIAGWVRLGWHPAAALTLLVEDEHGARTRIATKPDAARLARQSFALDPVAAGLKGNQIFISAVLPDGSMQPLPDAPLLLDKGVPPAAIPGPKTRPAAKPAGMGRAQPVDIIVPVYLGRAETLAALAAVLATRRAGDGVVVIDDASPDAALAADLDALAAKRSITLLRNERNLGFAASVNRGLEHNRRRDAILLNSDTVVHGDWIRRLQTAAYADAAIGTVTPLTNNGAIASYPGGTADACSADAAAALDRLAAEVNAGTIVDLPVGVGFCLYLRRDCLAEIGSFDAATFGKGYGEENDLCRRAAQSGWRNVLAADVFVCHAGGSSFGKRAAALRERNGRLLNLRHPGYDALVESFIAADPVGPVRRRLDAARLTRAGGRHVLLVTLALPGGVERFVRERCRVLRAQGFVPLLLQPRESGSAGCTITTEHGAYRDLGYAVPDELPALQALLAELAVDHVEIHHFLDFDRRVIAAAMEVGTAYDVYVHDYVWFCPRVSLIDGTGRYCGEPGVAACEACVRDNGSRLDEPISVRELRRRSARWLEGARAVIVPSQDVARRIARHFRGLAPRVEPWEAAPSRGTPPAPHPDAIRIAVIGAIGEHKGYRVLHDCARDAAARNLPLEFVVVGYTEDDDALIETGKVFVTGRYEAAELEDLLRRERPHLLFFPSVTPETWCYALTEALRSGVPIAAFDHGAIAERLREAGTGCLVPLDDGAGRLNDRLLAAATASWEECAATEARAPRPSRRRAAAAAPARAGRSVQEIQSMDKTSQAPLESKNAISGSVEVLTIPKGLYLFSVKAGSPARAKNARALALPAVHVGLGPGLSSNDVKFMPGVRGNGTWLFEAGNTLVTKVIGPTATLVLTSVRAAGGQALVIEVDRLDSEEAAKRAARRRRASASAVPAAASPPIAAAAVAAAPEATVARAGAGSRIVTHIRNRGDIAFVDAEWAGRVGAGMWIEAFAVSQLDSIAAADIEYKGLTRTGIETPWMGNGASCGTRGMSVPLIGFAARLKATAGLRHDCEYSGYFQSGAIVGPLRNGAPCRSSVPNDPLEGLQIRIVERTDKPAAERASQSRSAVPSGPQFGRFREEIAVAGTGAKARSKPKAVAAAKQKSARPARPPAKSRKPVAAARGKKDRPAKGAPAHRAKQIPRSP